MGNGDFPNGQRLSQDETLACCRHGTTRLGHTEIRDTSTGTWHLAPGPGEGWGGGGLSGARVPVSSQVPGILACILSPGTRRGSGTRTVYTGVYYLFFL